MRIAHLVTYISSDGAFGGPVSVAIAQATELARRGHEIELVAGWDGKAEPDAPGVAIRLFRVGSLPFGGFSGLYSLRLMGYFAQNIRRYDAVHIHLARDLVTLPAAVLAALFGVRYVVQPHGMIAPDKRAKARIFDALATHRVLRRASRVFALTEREQSNLAALTPTPQSIDQIPNGIRHYPEHQRPATPSGRIPEVVFIARLHPNKRVMAFANMARLLYDDGVVAKFTVFGPDEGDLSKLLEYIRSGSAPPSLTYEGPLKQGRAPDRLAAADVYVLPSEREVFPMTVLESLAVGTPSVVTVGCEISHELEQNAAALVTDGTPTQLASAVRTLLLDRAMWRELANNGRVLVREHFGIEMVADKLEAAYRGRNSSRGIPMRSAGRGGADANDRSES